MLGSAALSTDVSIRTVFTAQAPVAAGLPDAGSYRIEDVITSTLSPGLPDLPPALRRRGEPLPRRHGRRARTARGCRPEYVALASLPGTYAPTPWTDPGLDRHRPAPVLAPLREPLGRGELRAGSRRAFAAACGVDPGDPVPDLRALRGHHPLRRRRPGPASCRRPRGRRRAPPPGRSARPLRSRARRSSGALRALREMLGLRARRPGRLEQLGDARPRSPATPWSRTTRTSPSRTRRSSTWRR